VLLKVLSIHPLAFCAQNGRLGLLLHSERING